MRAKNEREIKAAVTQLGADGMRARLIAAVNAEYRKPSQEVDTALINACEDLLMLLDSPLVFAEREAERREALLEGVRARRKAARLRRRSLGSAAVAAAVMLLAIISDSALHWVGLIGRNVNNEQQYNIGGMEIDPALIAGSSAAGGALPRSKLITTSYDDATRVAGFTPALPVVLPDGWTASQYAVERSETSVSLMATYQKGGEYASYLLECFEDEKNAEAAYGAVATGDGRIFGGAAYLLSERNGQANCLWRIGCAVYQLRGPFSESELLSAAASVAPGEEAEGYLGVATLNTASFDEAVSVLGFTPPMPAYLPEQIGLNGYYVHASGHSHGFSASYSIRDLDELLNFSVTRYPSAEEAVSGGGFEQNCKGRTLSEQGVSYYIAYNYERPLIVWSDGLTNYFLSGAVAEEELLRMAVSVSGGNPLRVALHTVRHPVALITDEDAARIAKADLEAKYGAPLEHYRVDINKLRLSETRSDIMVEFRKDGQGMWQYAARINAQTGEVVASIDDVSWEPYSGGLLQPIGYNTDLE